MRSTRALSFCLALAVAVSLLPHAALAAGGGGGGVAVTYGPPSGGTMNGTFGFGGGAALYYPTQRGPQASAAPDGPPPGFPPIDPSTGLPYNDGDPCTAPGGSMYLGANLRADAYYDMTGPWFAAIGGLPPTLTGIPTNNLDDFATNQMVGTYTWDAYTGTWNAALGICIADAITESWTCCTAVIPTPVVIPNPGFPPFNFDVHPADWWNEGSIRTSPDGTNPTYVNIPTCAWMNGYGIPNPAPPIYSYAPYDTIGPNGPVTVWLMYTINFQPGAVTWNWGDGTSSSGSPGTDPGSNTPQYDPFTHSWSNGGCMVTHTYSTLSDGRTITATQPVHVEADVQWNDGVSNHSVSLLNTVDTITWGGVTKAVHQIEGVPIVA